MQARLRESERSRKEPIAVIGMSCRFPGGVVSPETYWQLLREGRDAIVEVPSDRWDVDLYYNPDPDALGKMCTRWGGFLDQIDQFDPELFGIAPREAVSMDPQQRLLLEVSWEALERSGQSPEKLSGSRSGVFVGIASGDYAQILSHNADRAHVDAYFASGVAHSIASGRLSYLLGLQGPSLSIDTACSSSLVAIHQACQSLRIDECRMALAGGVNVVLLPDNSIVFSKSHMMARDGRCKAFDARADGFVRSEGCGVVVLKRLSDALADGDQVLALIRASAINQDGPSSGLTAPNGPAQEALMREALAYAEISPADVSYVEAHGTGTSLGDPIEVRALGSVFGPGRPADRPLLIGSVKTNLGHLEASAGIASLIKVILALQHREIPPNLHFREPNPHIPWDELPVAVPTALRPWVGVRRIAGVSSFGFSGTNVHLVVEQAPIVESRNAKSEAMPACCEADRPVHILTISAKSEEALKAMAGRYAEHAASHPEEKLADICYTANGGRAHFAHRVAVLGDSLDAVHRQLKEIAEGRRAATSGQLSGTDRPRVAFLFTGQGSQYAGMGRQLFESQPTFREVLERCDRLLQPHLEKPLIEVLYPKPGESTPLDETAYTQPALFAMEYALAEMWRSWGIEPSVVMGHSVGEYVAACVAGLFSLEDGLKLIAARGRLMQALPTGGQMVAVSSNEARVRHALEPYTNLVSIAAINGPGNVVISGVGEAIEEIVRSFESEKIKTQRLVVSHAFHSPLMEPMLEDFERAAGQVSYAPSKASLVSNVTGGLLNPQLLTGNPLAYWRRHVRETVQFQKGMETLARQNCQVYLEVGPSPVLLGMGMRCLPDSGVEWLPTLRKGRGEWEQVLESLARLYAKGAKVDWAGFDMGFERRKVVLPTYPFQRQRYWIEEGSTGGSSPASSSQGVAATPESSAIHPLLGSRLESPALSELVFETRIGPDTATAFAYDHRIFGNPILPATVFVQMALEAAHELFGEGFHAVEDLILLDALCLPEKGCRVVQLIVSSTEEGSFRVFSREELSNSPWMLHGTGRIRRRDRSPAASESTESVETIKSRCRKSITPDAFYSALWSRGLEFGPILPESPGSVAGRERSTG